MEIHSIISIRSLSKANHAELLEILNNKNIFLIDLNFLNIKFFNIKFLSILYFESIIYFGCFDYDVENVLSLKKVSISFFINKFSYERILKVLC